MRLTDLTLDELKTRKETVEATMRSNRSEIGRLNRLIRKLAPEAKPAKPSVHKPLKANPKLAYEARKWHDQVFLLHGSRCYWCKLPATDAAHVLNRGMSLGNKRFCSPLLGVPACRACHQLETDNRQKFPLDIRQIATRALNRCAKIQRAIPVE